MDKIIQKQFENRIEDLERILKVIWTWAQCQVNHPTMCFLVAEHVMNLIETVIKNDKTMSSPSQRS